MRIAFFTATMGGAGHLVHALAVERGLRRQGFEGVFRVVGPEVPYPVEHGLDYVVGTVPRAAFRAAEAALATAAARELLAFDPDVLLVDMFWAPLTHVLPALRGEAWLLLHTVPRSWLRGPLKNRFQPELFARVLATEPMRHHPELDAIPPVVVCNPDEQQPVMALKQHLGVPLDQHLTLVAQTGMPGELERLAEQAKEQGSVVCSLSLRQPGALRTASWVGPGTICGGRRAGWGCPTGLTALRLTAPLTTRPFARRAASSRKRTGPTCWRACSCPRACRRPGHRSGSRCFRTRRSARAGALRCLRRTHRYWPARPGQRRRCERLAW